MCKPASFVVTKGRVFWCEKSDAHEDIIDQYEIHMDGARGPNGVRVEISPKGGDLSLPLKNWAFRVDQDQLPAWWDAKDGEKRCRVALKDWAKVKLSGWNVKEAFHPKHPFKRKAKDGLDLVGLLREWASVGDSVGDSVRDSVGDSVRASVWDSVRASVGDSVWDSVGDSVWDSVGDSVWDSVRASVGDSVWDSVWASVRDSVRAYIGGLFPGITSWKHAEKLGPDPWRPLLTLWYAGYVPSFDGATWRLHAGRDAKIVFEITAKELKEGATK